MSCRRSAGTSRQALNHWFTGNQNPTAKQILNVLEFLAKQRRAEKQPEFRPPEKSSSALERAWASVSLRTAMAIWISRALAASSMIIGPGVLTLAITCTSGRSDMESQFLARKIAIAVLQGAPAFPDKV
jgi:hypothetical protein